uniref:Gnk2-homologous domain-containing protein n=1 Tax=Kalanchoe fedtschenkoi TaxID=63787 RepID=A0A7N0UK54_KALFE
MCPHIKLPMILNPNPQLIRSRTNLSVLANMGLHRCTPRPDNATTESFKTNLNDLLTTLQQQAPLSNGFCNATAGESSDKLYGLAQCKGDLWSEDCASCLRDSVSVAFNTCTNSNRTALWFRWCFLRYSDEDFFGRWEGVLGGISYGNASADNLTVAAKGKSLMAELAAGVPSEPLMFKAGFVDVGDAGKRYGLAQCNRDLNASSCGQCLTAQVEFLDQVLGNNSMVDVISNGCNMWYNSYQFYRNSSSIPAQGPPPSTPPVMAGPPPPANASPQTPPPSAAPRQLQSSFTVVAVMTLLLLLLSSSAL